jgi:hypothetical protein
MECVILKTVDKNVTLWLNRTNLTWLECVILEIVDKNVTLWLNRTNLTWLECVILEIVDKNVTLWLNRTNLTWLECVMLKIVDRNMNVHGINDVRQREIHRAEPLVPEPTSFEVYIALEKLKSSKSPGTGRTNPQFYLE